MNQTQANLSRTRDLVREGLERVYYRVLEGVYLLTEDDDSKVVDAEHVAEELGLTYDTVLRAFILLSSQGYLQTQWPESRVCITPRGAEYVRRGAWRRRTVRRA